VAGIVKVENMKKAPVGAFFMLLWRRRRICEVEKRIPDSAAVP